MITHKISTRGIVSFGALLGLVLCQSLQASIIVGYDPMAPIGNFGSPGTKNSGMAYEITSSADATYAYFDFKARPDLGGVFDNSLDFANIYLSTVYPGGSTVGFELGNNRAFVPGVGGYYNNIAGAGVLVTHTTGDWSVAVPWSFLENDPLGMGFNKVTASNNKVTLNLSQAFGYSVAGGSANYGSDRLGLVEMTPVPEASTYIAGALLLLPFGANVVRRLRKAGNE